jgi:hypothetical protein
MMSLSLLFRMGDPDEEPAGTARLAILNEKAKKRSFARVVVGALQRSN